MIHRFRQRLGTLDPVVRTGRVLRVLPTHVEASGPNVPIGTLCSIEVGRDETIEAEVLSIDQQKISLAPFESMTGLMSGCLVRAATRRGSVDAGPELLGRVVDALGRPIDGGKPIVSSDSWSLKGDNPPPLSRARSDQIFKTGISVLDGLLTMSLGQRIGIFAPSGAGKTTLLAQIARQAEADVVIVCLIGERGREVEAIWNKELDAAARAKTQLIAATSDQTATMRVRACQYALAQADYWRSKGKHVVLFLDSATRLAMAMRELGLAAGEPPTVRAYTPNVFAQMPRYVERCGAVAGGGAITAIWTVLTESEEMDDPVSEMMKSLLDGHILLSRTIAEQGRFPAVDLVRSVSRNSETLLAAQDLAAARNVRKWLSEYEASRVVVESGLYATGSNRELDEAIARRPDILAFLAQGQDEQREIDVTRSGLRRLAHV